MNEIIDRDEWTFIVKYPCGESKKIYRSTALNYCHEDGVSLNEYLLTLDCPTHIDIIPRLRMSSDEEFLKIWQWFLREFSCVMSKDYIIQRISRLTS